MLRSIRKANYNINKMCDDMALFFDRENGLIDEVSSQTMRKQTRNTYLVKQC